MYNANTFEEIKAKYSYLFMKKKAVKSVYREDFWMYAEHLMADFLFFTTISPYEHYRYNSMLSFVFHE